MSRRSSSEADQSDGSENHNKRLRLERDAVSGKTADDQSPSQDPSFGNMGSNGAIRQRSRANSTTSQLANSSRASSGPRARSTSTGLNGRPSMRPSASPSVQGSLGRLSSTGYTSPSDSSSDEVDEDAPLPLGVERELVEAEAEHQGTDLEPRRRNKKEPVIPSSITSELRKLITEEAAHRRQEMQRINPTVHAAAINGNPNPITSWVPTAPPKYYICPMHTHQVLAIYDAMVASQTQITGDVEPASEEQLMQFATTYQCAWVDKFLSTMTQITNDPATVTTIPSPLGKAEHILVQHLFPAQTTSIIDREPIIGSNGVPLRDAEGWTSLDAKTNRLAADAYQGIPLVADARETVIPTAITYDVDSVIVYSDTLPLRGALETRAVPNPKDTFRYTNHLALGVRG
ncbi:hypothetical protein QFC22_006756 [Naganishia vaughanmartiniae]|uniref:Uncharacterized protein n=1 Tax=Naganishia vaughanmartiniae TaxID=1424756 RepID=A0ACC2WGC7_9TREE|nr:hypothetical protein QFC22_006756 [Naganishia vaughanmartiniae]